MRTHVVPPTGPVDHCACGWEVPDLRVFGPTAGVTGHVAVKCTTCGRAIVLTVTVQDDRHLDAILGPITRS
jgi:hypothetical protein